MSKHAVTKNIRRAAQRRVMAVYWEHVQTKRHIVEKEPKPSRQVRIREERKGLFGLVGGK